MSEQEKRAMRATLEAHMAAHPLGGMKSPYSWVSVVHMRPLVMVPVVILMLGSGTAFAAQGALPGDTLYPIKIHVNEAVAGALAVSDAAKATYNTQAAAERLKEAQALAAKNELSASATDELAQDYEVHATLAVAYADKVESNDLAKGASLRASLASLRAEGAVLATVAGQDGSEETRHNAIALASRTGAPAAEDARSDSAGGATLTIAMAAPASEPAPKAFAVQTLSVEIDTHAPEAQNSDTTRSAKSAAAQEPVATSLQVSARSTASLKAQASAQLEALRSLARSQTTLDASTSVALKARLDDLQTLIDSAQDMSGQEAVRVYQRALSQGAILKTFLSASKKFKLNILTPLLRFESETRGGDDTPVFNHDSEWRDDDTGMVVLTQTEPAAPVIATSSAPHTGTPSSTSADVQIKVDSTGGGTSGWSGSGGSAVQEIIQTVKNGLHL